MSYQLQLDALAARRRHNATKFRKNNADLFAGSPMYYYCRCCGEEMILPETHACPAPQYCHACLKLSVEDRLENQ
jgi:hypothetical protein